MMYYDIKSSLSSKQSIERLRAVFGDETPYQCTVYNQHNRFNFDRATSGDDLREGRPISAVTDENIV